METPAEKVRRLLGVDRVAAICGITPVQVYRWNHPIEKKGCGGQIPQTHYPVLLREAARRKVPLSLSDLDPALARAAQ